MPLESEQPTTASTSLPGWMRELAQLCRSLKPACMAQWRLLCAELGLARHAMSIMLISALVATITGVGLGLTLLCLIGFGLAQWLGSWLWALLLLCLMQGLLLLLALFFFRRGIHWMSFSATRREWRAMMDDTCQKVQQLSQAEEP